MNNKVNKLGKKISKLPVKTQKVIGLAILSLLLVTLPLFVWAILTQRFELRERAATGEYTPTPFGQVIERTGELLLVPLTATMRPGDIIPVEIFFRTGDTPSAPEINAITFRLILPVGGSSPDLEVVNASGNPTTNIQINQALIDESNQAWSYLINQVYQTSGQINIDMHASYRAVSPHGYATWEWKKLATIYLKANRVPATNPIQGQFDMGTTYMALYAPPSFVDILKPPASPWYYIDTSNNLSFKIRFQGLRDSTRQITKPAVLYLQSTQSGLNTYPFSANMISGPDYVFYSSPAVFLSNLPIGTTGTDYYAFVRSDYRLRRRLNTNPIRLLPGANSLPLDWPTTYLMAGDFTNDNILDVQDISPLLSVYTSLQVPIVPAISRFDVDENGVLNIYDINYVLANYTRLQVFGD